jgi:N-acetylglucosamine-6-phosphate deacetylase
MRDDEGLAPTLVITGGTVLDPGTGRSEPADLLLSGGRVIAVAAPNQLSEHSERSEHGQRSEHSQHSELGSVQRIDATGLLVAPGLIDLQVNGAAGVDVTAEPDRLWEVAAALPRHGVTSFLPTVVTTDERTRDRALSALAAGRPAGVPIGATPLGLHFEGPMLSPQRSGAHDRSLLRVPSAELIAGWSAEAGLLMVTLAPELPGALEVIRELVARGVLVSVGHTAADLAQVQAATEAGARAVTHLFNAMPGLDHREPGPVGAVLGTGKLVAGVIVDGLHVHPVTVAAAYRALGPHRFLSVSDTTSALDQPDGPSRLGGRPVMIQDGAVRLTDNGGLAGSAVGLDHCLRLLARFADLGPIETIRSATTVPADLLDRPDLGRLEPGVVADVALFSERLEPVATIVGGRLRHNRLDQHDQRDRQDRQDRQSVAAAEWTAV